MAALAPELLVPELLVPSDPGRFRADNLLGPEDWDAALYRCLDDQLDPALLFPTLDPDPMFDCGFGGGETTSPPDPPWELEPPQMSSELQLKAEPRSPSPPRCQSPPGERPPGTVPPPASPGVKLEPLPPRPVKGEGPPPRPPPPIQPRPPGGAPPSPPQTILLQPLPAGGAAPAVLLSPAELLLPGLLCLPPRPPAGPPPRPPAPPKPEAKTIVPAPAPAPPAPLQLDPQQLKRQQRMIKNRESASQSRRRRKEYVRALELRLRLALRDNERLRRENSALRGTIDALRAQAPAPPSPRRLACVAALLLFLAFNLGPRSLSPLPPAEPRGPAPPAPPPPPPRGQRHLLGVGGGGDTPPTQSWGPPRAGRRQQQHNGNQFRNASLGPVPLGGLFRGGDCPGFNRTESLRLADELSGWVRRHQIERQKPGTPPRPPTANPPMGAPGTVSPPRKVSSSPRMVPPAPPHPDRAPPGQLQLYGRPPHSAPPFLGTPHVLAAIAPRADTFYVVSFRRDHLLLPATSHNKTSRPKMSLVMPAAALNESMPGRGRGLAMMQVDCEVMDTRVIHVPRPPRRPPRPLYLGAGV